LGSASVKRFRPVFNSQFFSFRESVVRVNSEISQHRHSDHLGERHTSTRSGLARWAVIVTVVGVIAGGGGLWYGLATLSRQTMYAEKVVEARRHLQLSRDEAALEALSVASDTDAPPEYRYLKAIALDRLKRYEPAHAEIRRAITATPDDPKYKGLELKFRMLARERSAVDQLIELNRDYASTAAVALFAAYGFKAKAMLLQADGNPKSAEYHEQRKQQTLDTAITMAADIPELHPDLLAFAIREELPNEAMALIDGLLKLDPENISLRSRKVRGLVALKRIDDAAELARVLYEETDQNIQGAEYFASVLAQTTENKDRDSLFEDMLKRFPRSTVVVSKFAVYLTRSGRLPAAQKQIADAIDRQTDAGEREALAFVSITLPLEVNAPEVAEEYLRKNRKYLRDELLVDFFEARILYLRKQYGDAVRKMLQIVAASKKNEGGSRLFATEALSWVQRILAEKVMTEQFDRVIEATGKSEGPRVKIATEEQLKEFEKSKPTSEPAPAALSSKNAPKSPPETDAPASSPASPTP
jgi:tetratricopeptide (TPR) repeat protein